MFATIYLPNFYLQAATRHQPELSANPVALIETEDRKIIITQLNKNAEAAGVRIGMTPSQGLARLLSLIIKTRALEQEKVLSELLLQYAFTLSPNVEATTPGICTIEFTDHRDLLSKVSRVVEQLADSKIDAQAAIAPSPDTSLLGAHLARPVLEIDNANDFLAPLPIETLTISDC
jgi:hypothetical protein